MSVRISASHSFSDGFLYNVMKKATYSNMTNVTDFIREVTTDSDSHSCSWCLQISNALTVKLAVVSRFTGSSPKVQLAWKAQSREVTAFYP